MDLAQHGFGRSRRRACEWSWVAVRGCGLAGKWEVLLGVVLAVGGEAGSKECGDLCYCSALTHIVSLHCYFK